MEIEERKQALADFADGKIQMLTNCMILTEGYDQPDIDCVIMARPTKSKSLYIQMIGRGTRTFPMKKDCLILDFFDNSSRNDLANYKNCLDGVVEPLNGVDCNERPEGHAEPPNHEKDENRGISDIRLYQEKIQDIEFFEKAHFAWTPVGDSWHLRLSISRNVWVRQVKGGFLVVAQSDGQSITLSSRPIPLDYALGISEDWARKQTTKNGWARKDAPWRAEPATTKQLETLEKLGIKFDYGVLKGDAARLLDQKINEPATTKQIYWLRTRGVKFEPNISKLRARKLIADFREGA
jgi:hypothetical protein